MTGHSRSWMKPVVLASGLAIVWSCGTKQPPVSQPTPPAPPAQLAAAAPPPPPPAPARPAPSATVAAATPTEADLFARMSLAELNATHPLGDAFFAYDNADLTEAARTVVSRGAGWMRKWTSTQVVVEGHADERGTTEYNLMLGERRAASVRDYLVSLGISTARIRIVSKGEEQPFCSDHDEDCWLENRRAHFIVTAK